MTFLDYLIFNLSVAGGALSIVATVFLGAWMADSLHDGRHKNACIAGLLMIVGLFATCAIVACGCVIGDRMFQHSEAMKKARAER